MNELQTKRITALLAAAYPSWRPSEATLQLYERLLRPLPAALAERAVLEIIHSEREFAPPAGAICHRAGRLAIGRGSYPALGAEEAWSELADVIRIRGCYRPPKFDNPVLGRAVAAIGWSELCTNPNTEATRAHFFRLFEAFAANEIARRVEELSAGTACAQLAEGWSGAAEPGLQAVGGE